MSRDLSINVHHVTRVEGHGNIVVDVKNGVLKKAELDIVEPPRFFEAMLKGRNFHEVAIITSRICGICSLGHQMTSLKATEAALGLEISEQTEILRKILVHGATFQSNVLHALFLAAPDFLNVGSVFPLVNTHKEVVLAALRLKRLANDMGEVISGRAVHPISIVPGGFTKLPTEQQLKELRERLTGEGMKDALFAIDVLASLADQIPQFERETEYISLYNDQEYGLYDGVICSSDAGLFPVEDYERITNEFVVPHSTSKHTRFSRSSYMVGALARFNNSHKLLKPKAQEVAQKLGLKAPCHNPYMITVAQMVEVIHCIEDSIDLIDVLLERGIKDEKPNQEPKRYGRGIAATEVPRGILFHDYTYNRKGQIVKANCIIPTGQNLANIDDDMKKLVPEILNEPKEAITKKLEMLVRAYDPCISCSVHMLDVTFEE
ncbi:nickel-dependent hydrogenase large subunit [Caldithrix abyssi DSM 13497]|uniref:Coenzyme F420-reducing hydrogenase, alpha subunit n=1 Tax=Caldithrix abyssi DSM 13497 TaxID=880073 RepID=H1XQX1_CALAY|nr:Ni/Fe hydrogenase subunit alpha [Caldithrix abyssi]APF19977.1 Coenzyme F420-reducing hydrogenase, alpha subunit [Caldithrix abyssi DSM 13497]EHO40065.1 nickel-dependent hydrogenase large subunit [Caldithrix abyssi DSM 13497]